MAFALLAIAVLPGRPAAHEVPADVTVYALVQPSEGVLRVLVRVPLTSMRDVEFPLFGVGYVNIEEATTLLVDLAHLWLVDYVDLFEDGALLDQATVVAARISLPSDRSFQTPQRAMAHINAPPLSSDVALVLEQALMDVWLEAPIASTASRFSIHAAWAHLGVRTTTVLRFDSPELGSRVLQYEGSPGLVHLDPSWFQAVFRFTKLGFLHILSGLDHLLFLFCLVIPFRQFKELVRIVTAFTVAHSITLAAAVFGYAPDVLWFPPLIEVLIAVSILFMAFENIVGAGMKRRWLFAFAFGLVHGFGFSFLLSNSLQYAGSHIVGSLLAFNVGVELGQLALLLVVVPLLGVFFRRVVEERLGGIILSALVAHTAWHWMTERVADLVQYRVSAPVFDRFLLAGLLRFLILAIIVFLAWWGLDRGFSWLRKRAPEDTVAGA